MNTPYSPKPASASPIPTAKPPVLRGSVFGTAMSMQHADDIVAYLVEMHFSFREISVILPDLLLSVHSENPVRLSQARAIFTWAGALNVGEIGQHPVVGAHTSAQAAAAPGS